MSKREKKVEENGLTGDEWLATYSDTVTLLLTFFVLLYSFSMVDAAKFKQIASSFQSVFSGKPTSSILEFNETNGTVPIVGEEIKTTNTPNNTKKDVYDQVKQFVSKSKMEGKIKVKQGEKGIVLELRDNILFDIGSAEIKPNSKPVLDMITNVLNKFPNNEIIVEGHTDNVPISNYNYPSNWELSTSRAVNVLKYFVQNKGMNPGRFTAAGYGEFKPIAPNNNDVNKSKNRRVNIIIADEVLNSNNR